MAGKESGDDPSEPWKRWPCLAERPNISRERGALVGERKALKASKAGDDEQQPYRPHHIHFATVTLSGSLSARVASCFGRTMSGAGAPGAAGLAAESMIECRLLATRLQIAVMK